MRVWLYDTLIAAPTVEELVEDRVFPRESFDSSVVKKPFLVYGLGNDTNEHLSDEDDHEAHRQFFQIWIHDEGGDYSVIDDGVQAVKDLMKGASSKEFSITTVRWLETSQEFSDQTMNTIFRYIRFQAIISRGATL